MATYLLTWNPSNWAWTDLPFEARKTARGQQVVRRWSTGNTKRIVVGDRLFLMKQGSEPRGIIASGTAISDVADRPHWDSERAAKGDETPCVMVRFDAILDPFESAPMSVVDQPSLQDVAWNTPASGISIADHAASAIEDLWPKHLEGVKHSRFEPGKTYTREDVQRLLGLEPVQGGNWYTGYHKHGEEWFLFPGVGTGGRTGHDYGNAWVNGRLQWSGRTGSRVGTNSIDSLTAAGARVHLFTREKERDPFTYHGLVKATQIKPTVPVQIEWELLSENRAAEAIRLPEEQPNATYTEGSVSQILVNAFERNPAARRACIVHYGAKCAVCGLNMAERYGPIADGFIHVHHLKPLASVGEAYQIDPIRDLRPVCPNCHAVIHLENPPLTIEQVLACLNSAGNQAKPIHPS